jgi:L-serine dehydratase
MRSAVIGATAVILGRSVSAEERTERSTAEPPQLSPDLNVVKGKKGPVMTTLDEFYKVGPGPSSSHTIGPMRITHDFYQRCTKLPADQLTKATALKVHLFGSLSSTGKGHGTERAALAGLVGKEPATVDPAFLDSLRDKPDQSFPVKLGTRTVNVTLQDVVYDAPKGDFPHPNTMTCRLMAGNDVLLEQEYYSVGGGFIEWKGYTPPKRNSPKYPFSTMKELRQHAETNKLTIAQVILANEMAIPGKSEAEVYAFVDKITNAMVAIVKSGLNAPEDDVLPGPIKLHSKAATVYRRAMGEEYQSDRGIGVLSAFALAASEENGRGHLVVTAPTGGSAGVLPALVYGLSQARKVPADKIRQGMLAAAAIGYLCKHNATLSAAEGGCQAEIGVASAMGAALMATVYDASARVVENAAESALEHHLGMTCDPVAGFVQVPCIERCAFGAVKAWTAWAIASNEIESRHRVDLDATVTAMAQTAMEMNGKYKETSEAGLALSVTLC